MALEDYTNSARQSPPAGGPLAALPASDRELGLTVATVLLDVVGVFGCDVTAFVYDHVSNLPRDEEAITRLEKHAEADAFEVLITLKAQISPDAYSAPTEAISHARYLRSRGVGFQTLVQIYREGFAVFREVIINEIRARTDDPGQIQRVTNLFDAYGFPFVESTLRRLSYEFGAIEGGWSPRQGDEEFGASTATAAAAAMRDKAKAEGNWTAATVEQSRAKARAEDAIDTFARTFEDGVRKYGLGERLAQAKTSVTLTLADEPSESVSLLLDRAPVEIVEGDARTEAHIWIASTDLARLWSPDFYLPMAIAAGRVRTEGPARSFLRVLPIIRSVGGVVPDRYNPHHSAE